MAHEANMTTVKAKLEFDIEKAKEILQDYADTHGMTEQIPDWVFDKLKECGEVVFLDDTGEPL